MPEIPFLHDLRGVSHRLAMDEAGNRYAADLNDFDIDYVVGEFIKRKGSERLAILPDRGSFQFDAANEGGSATGVTTIDTSASFSCGCIIKSADYTNGTQRVFRVQDEGGTNDLDVWVDSNGKLNAQLDDGSAQATCQLGSALTDGKQYHWHVIFDATNDVLYLIVVEEDSSIPLTDSASTSSLSLSSPGTTAIDWGNASAIQGYVAEMYWMARDFEEIVTSGNTAALQFRWYVSISNQSFSARADDLTLLTHLWRGDDGDGAGTAVDAKSNQNLTLNNSPTWTDALPEIVATFGPEGNWHATNTAIIIITNDTEATGIDKGTGFYSVNTSWTAALMGGAPGSANIPTFAWLDDKCVVCFGDIENRVLYDADPGGSGDPSIAIAGIRQPEQPTTLSVSGTGVDALFKDGAASAISDHFDTEADNAGILGANTTDTGLSCNFGDATAAVTSCALTAKDTAAKRIDGGETTINMIVDVTTPPAIAGSGMRFGLVGAASAPTSIRWGDKSDYICFVTENGSAWIEWKVGGGTVTKSKIEGNLEVTRLVQRWVDGKWHTIAPRSINPVNGWKQYRIVWPHGDDLVVPTWQIRFKDVSRGRAYIAQGTHYKLRLQYDGANWRIYNGKTVITEIPDPGHSVTNWYPTIGFTGGGVQDGDGWFVERMVWGTGKYVGTYTVWTSFYDNDRRVESNASDPVTIEAAAQDISVTAIPPPSQLGITHVRVYRSPADEDLGYLDGTAAITATSYAMAAEDNFTDTFDPLSNSTVGLPLQFGARTRAPRAKFVTRHIDRLVYGGLDTTDRSYYGSADDEPQDQVCWSLARRPEYVPRGAILSDYMELDGNAVTGIISDGRRLFVFEQARSWVFGGDLAGVSATGFNILDHDHGCVAGRGLARIGRKVFVPTHAGIRMVTASALEGRVARGGFDGTHMDRAWRGQTLDIAPTLAITQAARDAVIAVAWPERHEIWWTVRKSGSTENDLVLILDTENWTWRTYALYAQSLGIATLSALEDVVYGDGQALFRYRGDRSGTDADGDPGPHATNTTVFTPSSASSGTTITDTGSSFKTGTSLKGVRVLVLAGTGAGSIARVVSSTANVLTVDRSITVGLDSTIVLGTIDAKMHVAAVARATAVSALKRVTVAYDPVAAGSGTHRNATVRAYGAGSALTDTEGNTVETDLFLGVQDSPGDTVSDVLLRARHRRLSVQVENRYPDSPLTIHAFTVHVRGKRLKDSSGSDGGVTAA